MQVQSLGWEDLLEEEMANTSVFLPGKFHGQSLAGYSPWGCKELDMTEHAHTHTSCYCLYAAYTGLSFPQTLSVVTAYMSHLKSTNII